MKYRRPFALKLRYSRKSCRITNINFAATAPIAATTRFVKIVKKIDEDSRKDERMKERREKKRKKKKRKRARAPSWH